MESKDVAFIKGCLLIIMVQIGCIGGLIIGHLIGLWIGR